MKNVQQTYRGSLKEGKVKKETAKAELVRLRALTQQQADFIAITAHEFRSPLAVAMLQLESTLSSTGLLKPIREDLKVLEESLEKLKDLTQELFEAQRYDLDRVELDPKKIGFFYFISDLHLEFRELMAKKGIALHLKHDPRAPLFISIDRPKMRQALRNLLYNAYKFTPENGRVLIETACRAGMITISVRDNGTGIDPSAKSQIFEKYQSGGRNPAGLGLGLYLCRKIVELHRGEISVSDVPGGGSCFTIRVPQGDINR